MLFSIRYQFEIINNIINNIISLTNNANCLKNL